MVPNKVPTRKYFSEPQHFNPGNYVGRYSGLQVCRYVCVCTNVCMYLGMYVCMRLCVHVCMRVCMSVHLWEQKHMSVCICMCMNVCMYVCMYICMRLYYLYVDKKIERERGRQTASLKADTAAPAARRDLSRTTTRPTTDSAGEASTANSHRPATTPTVPHQASTESSNSLTKQQTAAAADHKQRLATNPYLHGRSDSHLSDPDRDQHHRAETSSEAAKDGRPQPSTTPGTGSQPQPKQPPRRQPPTPPLPRRPDHQVQFRLPPDHRDQPPRPQRMRPNTSHASQRQPQPPVTEGDPLFTQPPHSRTDQQPSSTAGSSTDPPRPDATATATNSQPPGIADLHRAATAAAMQGRAPSWRITARHQRGDSLQSTHRVGANSQDLSWLPGASPTTLPPPFPLQARTILSLRGAANGAWRGNVWIPLPDQTVSHPVRHEHEPTLVAYNTLGSYVSSDPVMPPGTQFTIWPYGEIIGVTKIGDGFARTPRFWLFQVDFAPKPEEGNNPLQISSGESFWLEWRGEDRSWRRHPRFTDDVTRFGGPAVFSLAVPPRPPTPPERRHPTGRHPSRTRAHQQHHTGTPTQQSQPSGAANNTHHPRHTQQTPATAQRAILDPAALQGAAFATLHAAQQQGRGMGPQQQPRSVTQPVSQQQAPPRRLPTTTPNRSQAVPKPRPPQPPDSGSESETSWRSEDPPGPDAAPLLQVQLRNHSHHNHHNHPEHERHGHASAPPQPRPYNSPPPPTQLPLWSRGLAPAMTLLTTSAPRRPEGNSSTPSTTLLQSADNLYHIHHNHDLTSLMQHLPSPDPTQRPSASPAPPLDQTTATANTEAEQPPPPAQPNSELTQLLMEADLQPTPPILPMLCAGNTPAETITVLRSILHNLLQQSFLQPREDVTDLAYRAAFLVSRLEENLNVDMPPNGGQDAPVSNPPGTGVTFVMTNPLGEAREILAYARAQCEGMSLRELRREIVRAGQSVTAGRGIFKSWLGSAGPALEEGLGATQNALTSLDMAHLQTYEGGVANLQAALTDALGSTNRACAYLDQLLLWIQAQHGPLPGEPSPKRTKGADRAASSHDNPFADRVQAQPQGVRDRAGPHRDAPPGLPGDRGEATPWQVLRGQQLLEGILPFLEQEVAQVVAQAHGLLLSWTTALWGVPVQLVEDSVEAQEEGEVTSETATVPFEPQPFEEPRNETLERGLAPVGSSARPPLHRGVPGRRPLQRHGTHRRRRMHAAFDSASDDEKEDTDGPY